MYNKAWLSDGWAELCEVRQRHCIAMLCKAKRRRSRAPQCKGNDKPTTTEGAPQGRLGRAIPQDLPPVAATRPQAVGQPTKKWRYER